MYSNCRTLAAGRCSADAGHNASATFAHLGEMLDRKEIYVYPVPVDEEGDSDWDMSDDAQVGGDDADDDDPGLADYYGLGVGPQPHITGPFIRST
eukprot:scaffold47167_cov36-Phaeocystis_antarctica.AAC.2